MASTTRNVKKKALKQRAPKGSNGFDLEPLPEVAPDEKAKKFVHIPALRTETLLIDIVGVTDYVQNRLSPATLGGIEEGRIHGGMQLAGAKIKEQAPLDPHAQMLSKLHWIQRVDGSDGQPDLAASTYGIPVAALKKSIATVTFQLNALPFKFTFGAMNIKPSHYDLVKLRYDGEIYMRRGYKSKPKFLIYYQPVFPNWSCTVEVVYDLSMTRREHVIEMLKHAGMKVGIGNNRPEKGGENGIFDVGGVQIVEPPR